MHDKNSTILATTSAPTLPPPHASKIKVIVIGSNGGGVCKTKTALLFGTVERIRAGRAAAPSSTPHAPVITAPVSLPDPSEDNDGYFRVHRAPCN